MSIQQVGVFAFLWVSASAVADSGSCAATFAQSDDELSADWTIGRIDVQASNLFDLTKSKQGKLVHSAANALHWVSRDQTVLDALPFRSGDVFSAEILVEGERVLRSRRYIRDAIVSVAEICDRRVDIEVQTIDNWTLTPSISFGQAGGDSRFSFEIQDLNALGFGKELKLRQSHSGDGKISSFVYSDDNVVGSHHMLRLGLGETDHGNQFSLVTGLPLYTELTKHTWQLLIDKRIAAINGAIDESQYIPVETKQVSVKYAVLRATMNDVDTYLGGGVRKATQLTDTDAAQMSVSSMADFREIYPFLSAEWKHEKWERRQNFRSLRVTEDIDLGYSVALELGLISKGLGNAENAMRLDLKAEKSWAPSAGSWHKVSLRHTNYLGPAAQKKHTLSARYRYFRWISDSDQLDFRLTGETRRGYSPLYDYAIGGADGIRAYSTEHQVGDNRILGLAEYRHITPWTPWSLANIAVSFFVEAGQAWHRGLEQATLADAGFGLQISPTRSSRAAINRIDIAFPLTNSDSVDSFQLFIGSKINF